MSMAKCYRIHGNAKLVLQRGDLTKWKGDAIVNAANEGMLGGGGVDGAIHRAAGPGLLKACREIKPSGKGVRCPTGQARITPGFKLPAEYVIHTVGPFYSNEEDSAPLLESAYRSSLVLANEYKMKTIAFPAISCGIFRYPLGAAARVALKAVRDHFGCLEEIHFLFFEKAVMMAYIDSADEIFKAHEMDAGDVADENVEDRMEVDEVFEGCKQMDISLKQEISEVLDAMTDHVSSALGELPLNDIDNIVENSNDTGVDMMLDNAVTLQEGCSMLHERTLTQDNNCTEVSGRSKVSPKTRSRQEASSETSKRLRLSSLEKEVDAG